jgi:hypothetical protein
MSVTTKNVAHPARRVIRGAVQFTIGLGPLLPLIYQAATNHDPAAATGLAAAALGINASVTRVMGLPGVEAFLQRWVPWLAANPKP